MSSLSSVDVELEPGYLPSLSTKGPAVGGFQKKPALFSKRSQGLEHRMRAPLPRRPLTADMFHALPKHIGASDDLCRIITDLSEELERLRAEREGFLENGVVIETTQFENVQLREKLAAALKRNDQLGSSQDEEIKQLAKSLSSRETELIQLKASEEKAQTRLKILEDALATRTNEIEQLRSRNEAITAELTAANKRIEELTELTDPRAAFAESCVALSSVVQDIPDQIRKGIESIRISDNQAVYSKTSFEGAPVQSNEPVDMTANNKVVGQEMHPRSTEPASVAEKSSSAGSSRSSGTSTHASSVSAPHSKSNRRSDPGSGSGSGSKNEPDISESLELDSIWQQPSDQLDARWLQELYDSLPELLDQQPWRWTQLIDIIDKARQTDSKPGCQLALDKVEERLRQLAEENAKKARLRR